MKYLVNLTAPVNTTLNADNLRGEPRWERNAVDALVSGGRDVHTVLDVWRSPLPCPNNLHSGIKSEWLDDSIMITYGVPARTHIGDTRAKYYMVQYLDGPTMQTRDEFLKFNREKPNSIVAMCGFRSFHWLNTLQGVLGHENVEFVEGPAVPYVVDSNNFDKPYLFWAYRNFYDYIDRESSNMEILFYKINSFLQGDPNLRVALLVHPWGAKRDELMRAMAGDRSAWFKSLSIGGILGANADRVDIFSELNWHEMLDLMSKTRLIISPPEPLGGPPYEASMYGIPIVLCEDTNPFQDSGRTPFFPELLRVPPRTISNQFINELEHLFRDYNYYSAHGNAYRNYTRDHATYDAWIKQIDLIAQKRGWH